jgi:hypothetical protein
MEDQTATYLAIVALQYGMFLGFVLSIFSYAIRAFLKGGEK